MRKYPTGENIVGAIYDNAPADTPLLASLPEMLSQAEFMKEIASFPKLPFDLPSLSNERRRQELPRLSSLFIPMDYMYSIYDQLSRAIRSTYTTRTTVTGIRQINNLYNHAEGTNFSTQADSGSILGVPGIGKTSTIRRCLGLLPQVVEHTEYQGKPFFTKQVLYLHIECPSDCSIKTLAFNILAALDRAIGSDYINRLTLMRSVSASAIAAQVKILCMTHQVGLLLVDEIQNVILTARKNRQIKPLLKFLVELTNDTGTATYFIGTPEAEELFISQEHLKRRTRGVRLLPLKPDGAFRMFLAQLWEYQLTPEIAPLTDKLADKIYDHSAGIPAYIIKIFIESQVQALLTGSSHINEKMVQRAVDILAIKIPRTFSGGTSISSFQFERTNAPLAEDVTVSTATQATISFPADQVKEVPRLYANKRGRPTSKRDPADLLMALRTGADMLEHLRSHELLEVFEGC